MNKTTLDLSTLPLENGKYVITAFAKDDTGNYLNSNESDSIEFIVNNGYDLTMLSRYGSAGYDVSYARVTINREPTGLNDSDYIFTSGPKGTAINGKVGETKLTGVKYFVIWYYNRRACTYSYNGGTWLTVPSYPSRKKIELTSNSTLRCDTEYYA